MGSVPGSAPSSKQTRLPLLEDLPQRAMRKTENLRRETVTEQEPLPVNERL